VVHTVRKMHLNANEYILRVSPRPFLSSSLRSQLVVERVWPLCTSVSFPSRSCGAAPPFSSASISPRPADGRSPTTTRHTNDRRQERNKTLWNKTDNATMSVPHPRAPLFPRWLRGSGQTEGRPRTLPLAVAANGLTPAIARLPFPVHVCCFSASLLCVSSGVPATACKRRRRVRRPIHIRAPHAALCGRGVTSMQGGLSKQARLRCSQGALRAHQAIALVCSSARFAWCLCFPVLCPTVLLVQ
jgi:hypothetical protein